jgi:GTP-binding protein HflX
VVFPGQEFQSGGALAELEGLARACGAEPAGEVPVQRRERPNASTLFGRGKVDEIADEVRRTQVDAVVVDNDLTPAQVRNLEKRVGVRIIDRSELILDIFASRAQTRQARLQVELAQVEYLLPRLRRMWTHLERMEGAIGTRGPGETQLETDRRLLRKRVRDLQRQLREIEEHKRRQVQSRAEEFTIGLVGYTNAGKSTLLNQLTGADVLAEDMLFATLDTRTRKWTLSDGRLALLSDTVGFLQRLPHHLVASFHATLEEALNVDLLVHVVDASHPDAAAQMRAVEGVLRELSRHREADVIVFNKVDRVDDPLHVQLLVGDREQESVYVSALTGEGLYRFDEVVRRRLDARSVIADVTVPMTRGAFLATAKRLGVVLGEDVVGDTAVRVRIRVLERTFGGLRRRAPEDVGFDVVAPAVEPYMVGESMDDALRDV